MSYADQFRRALTREQMPGAGIHALGFRALTACDCGCGLPARVEIRIGTTVFSVCDPVQVDQLVDMLIEGRARLWGPRPGPARGGGS